MYISELWFFIWICTFALLTDDRDNNKIIYEYMSAYSYKALR